MRGLYNKLVSRRTGGEKTTEPVRIADLARETGTSSHTFELEMGVEDVASPAESEIQLKGKGNRKFVIECRNLNVHISGKHILKNINAAFLPGTLTALMGPSGAGESLRLVFSV